MYQDQVNPYFQPAMRVVTAITNGFPATVTTDVDHLYITGTIVRLLVPPGFGMEQANQQVGSITVTSPTTFTLPLNTTSYDPFAYPALITLPNGDTTQVQFAQVIPIGEDNDILTAAVQNVLLPGYTNG